MKDPTAQKALAAAGLDPMTMSQSEFAAFVKAEYARWEQIVKDAGVERKRQARLLQPKPHTESHIYYLNSGSHWRDPMDNMRPG